MGIESDRMVFDYLSEVGDLAQQRQLPPGDRSAPRGGRPPPDSPPPPPPPRLAPPRPPGPP
ncbi:hypothetical protein ACFW1I_01585, partial [Streptomyces sp. NPDC058955]